jgi:hypothetical protein
MNQATTILTCSGDEDMMKIQDSKGGNYYSAVGSKTSDS